MTYSVNDINEAKAFILRRVEAEVSMQSHLDDALMWAAKEIVRISYKYRISASMFRFSANKDLKREVDAVLAKLRAMIYEYTEQLSVAVEEKESSHIIAYINDETYGKTLKERINQYTNRYSYELESIIAAGLLYKYGKDKLLDSIRSSLTAPYNNRLFLDSVKHGGMSATRIKTGGISYGQGHSNSARNLLNTLTRNAVGMAWMMMYGQTALNKGAVGFYSFRGSSYPCAHCDSMVGYHPISEYQGIWHLNCRCYFVFVYN